MQKGITALCECKLSKDLTKLKIEVLSDSFSHITNLCKYYNFLVNQCVLCGQCAGGQIHVFNCKGRREGCLNTSDAIELSRCWLERAGLVNSNQGLQPMHSFLQGVKQKPIGEQSGYLTA